MNFLEPCDRCTHAYADHTVQPNGRRECDKCDCHNFMHELDEDEPTNTNILNWIARKYFGSHITSCVHGTTSDLQKALDEAYQMGYTKGWDDKG